jgi:4'-phosphopantetheinyl transferase
VATVTVTFATLDADAGALRACWAVLDASERARAAKFAFERDRRRFVVRRARLRRLLAAHTGIDAADLHFEENCFGKPRLAEGPHFSLSYSGERMIVAIAEVELGCDIERIDPALAWRPLADTLFERQERASLADLSGPAARSAFFHCWARKEAFVKALGLGLSYPLEAFAVSVSPEATLLAGGEGWAMGRVEGGPGYAAAVVARDDGLPLVIRTSESRSTIASRANSIASPA